MLNKGIPQEYGLRVGVRGGGCGATFLLGFDKKKTLMKPIISKIFLFMWIKST